MELMNGYIVVFYLALGAAFIPSLITMFLVIEREDNVKHQ